MNSAQRQSLKLTVMVVLGLAFAFSAFTVARSQSTAADVKGPFMLAGGDRTMVWRIDQSTGKVSYCTRDTASTDQKYLETYSPYCSGWSPQ
jgi:hypothetical protein